MDRQRPRGTPRRLARLGLALVSPTMVTVVVVLILPIAWTLVLSISEIRLIDLSSIGILGREYTLENFRSVLTSGRFWSSTRATIVYTAGGTLASVALGLIAALAVRRTFRAQTLVRSAFLLPYVMPAVAAVILWRTLLNPRYGWVNAFGTSVLGWDAPISFLSQASAEVSILGLSFSVPVAMTTVIVFEMWRSFPFSFLFLLAALQSMPSEIEEAAQMDGASILQRFRFIVYPQLRNVISILLLLRAMFLFQNFTDVYLLTGGAGNTQILSLEVYTRLVARSDLGGAAALGLVMLVLILPPTLAYLRSQSREERIG